MVTSHTEVWIEISTLLLPPSTTIVTSHTEVWIEIVNDFSLASDDEVTSHTEVWIEIWLDVRSVINGGASPPIRRCGLKFYLKMIFCYFLICHLPYGGVD